MPERAERKGKEMKKMTYKTAIEILIRNAVRNVNGVGCGLRPEVTSENTKLVYAAARLVWKRTNHFELTDNDMENFA